MDVRPPRATTALQERLRLRPELLHQPLELLAQELLLLEQELGSLAQAWRALAWSLRWKASSPSCPSSAFVRKQQR